MSNDSQRWPDADGDASSQIRALLASAAKPDPNARAQGWARLESAVATAANVPASSAVPGGSLGSWPLVVIAFVAAATLESGSGRHRAEARAYLAHRNETTVAIASPAASSAPPAMTEAASAPIAITEAAPAPMAITETDRRPPSARATASSSRRAVRPSDLAEETALLGDASEALRSDPARALSLASAHAQRFPTGVLHQERDALTVRALIGLGRTREAVRLADAFLAREPGSGIAGRVRSLRARAMTAAAPP